MKSHEVSKNASDQTIQFPSSRKFIRGAAALAVILDGFLYSAYLSQNAPDGVEALITGLGINISDEILSYVKIAVGTLIPFNLLCDLLAVNHMKEADDLALSFTKKRNFSAQQKKRIKTYIAILVLGFIIKGVAASTVFPVVASADAIPLAVWIDNYFGKNHPILANLLRYGSLITIGSLETLYCMMFLNPRIEQHASALVHTLKDFPNFCKQIGRNVFSFAEVLLQVFPNAANRGIKLTFIMSSSLELFFSVSQKSDLNRQLSIAAGITSFFMTFFTRYLSVYGKFFNEDHKLITEEYPKENGFGIPYLLKCVFGIVRGTSMAALLANVLTSISPFNYCAGAITGSFLTGTSLYSQYELHRKRKALKKISPEELKQRKKDLSGESSPLLINTEKSESRISQMDAQNQSLSQIILMSNQTVAQEDAIANKNRIFDQIADSQNSPRISFTTAVIVNFTQLVRLLAFALFIKVVNEQLLDSRIGPWALLLMTVGWGLPVWENDSALYSNAINETITHMAARWKIISHRDKTDNLTASSRSWCGLYHVAKKGKDVMTTSVYDFREKIMNEVLATLHP